MNLLITGGAGFIGSNLIHQIVDRAEIKKLVNLDCLTYAGHLANLETVSGNPKYVFEKVDLRDKSATLQVVEKYAITHVMHLAAESHVDRSISGPGDFIQTNVVGTFNLLEACRGFWSGDFTEKKFHHDEHSRHVQSARSLSCRLAESRIQNPESRITFSFSPCFHG